MEFIEEKLGNMIDLTMGQSPKSEYYNFENIGMPFLQGNKDFGFKYPLLEMYTSKVTKVAEKNDILMSVRAPVGDINIAPEKLCIGRGLCSLKMKNSDNTFLYYLLKYYSRVFINNESGTVFGSINKNDISNLIVSIPKEIEDQNKIGQILNQIDTKIEINMKINNNFWFFKDFVMKQFCGGLNGF